MKKYFSIYISILVSVSFITLASVANQAIAQSGGTISGVQYPVKELGGCVNKSSCKKYCDESSHAEACLSFAEKRGLMSAGEITKARNFLSTGDVGPGGCKGADACKTYCDSVSNLDECVAYAEKYGLLTPERLSEAKKIQAATARGVKMPACSSKTQCDTYCSDSANMEECITFSQEAGMMAPQELEQSKKVLAVIKSGVKAPACNGKEECDVYCSQEIHFDECLNFSIAAGFMDPKEAEMAKKTKGAGPNGCRGKAECDAYCENDANFMVCAQFGLDNGMIDPKQFEMMKKTNGKGPGGCRGQQECDNFCNNPNNQETCFAFGKENGMISEGDLKKIEEGNQRFKESMANMPPEVYACMEVSIGIEASAKFKSGTVMPTKDIGEKMGACFDQNAQRPGNGGPGEGGNMAPGDQIPNGEMGPGQNFGPGDGKDMKPGDRQPFQVKGPDGQEGGPGNMLPCEGDNCPVPQQPAEGGGFSPTRMMQQGVQFIRNTIMGTSGGPMRLDPGTDGRPFAPGTTEGIYVQGGGPGNMPPCEGDNCPIPQQPQQQPVEGGGFSPTRMMQQGVRFIRNTIMGTSGGPMRLEPGTDGGQFAPGTSGGQDGQRPTIILQGPNTGGNMKPGDYVERAEPVSGQSMMEGPGGEPCGENCAPSRPPQCEGRNCPPPQSGTQNNYPPQGGMPQINQAPQQGGTGLPGNYVQPPQPVSVPTQSGGSNMAPINTVAPQQLFMTPPPQGTGARVGETFVAPPAPDFRATPSLSQPAPVAPPAAPQPPQVTPAPNPAI